MADCAQCGEHEGLSATCNYCGREHCQSHALPENHRCPGLEAEGWEAYKKAREKRTGGGQRPSREPSSPVDEGRVSTPPKKKIDRHGWASGNVPTVGDGGESAGSADGDGATRWSRPARSVVGMVVLLLSFLFSWRGVAVFLAVGVVVGGYSAVVGTGVEPIDQTVGGAVSAGQEMLSAGGDLAADGLGGPSDLNTTRTDRLVHEMVNQERRDRGLSTLSPDASLQEVARSHSRDMANRQYYSHVSPSGADHADRYRQAGYGCAGTSGENIMKTYAFTDVVGPNGQTVIYSTDREVARGIVDEWMNSSGHRQMILHSDFRVQGAGIATRQSEEHGGVVVYATLDFC